MPPRGAWPPQPQAWCSPAGARGAAHLPAVASVFQVDRHTPRQEIAPRPSPNTHPCRAPSSALQTNAHGLNVELGGTEPEGEITAASTGRGGRCRRRCLLLRLFLICHHALVVAHIRALHPEDHVLGNVGGMV